jgi:acyl-CoA reductase-like NAD-dependent aldehyde dehydrogenase
LQFADWVPSVLGDLFDNRRVQYGFSASIYTQDVNRAFTAEVHLPFGGTKSTGNGHRDAGTAALDVGNF